MKLYIAEKPSVANDIAKALGGSIQKKNGYIEAGEDLVTWCYGHLLKTVEPESYNPDYKKWVAADLPLQLYPLRYEPIASNAAHTQIVIDLIKKADVIVHAGDPDDEGQLLVEELLEYAGNSKPVKRLLINDNTDAAVKKSLAQLKDNREFRGIYRKALARAAGDLIYGLSMTRAYTIAGRAQGYNGTLSVGRVQTPILGLIVRRYLANQSHTSSFYYTLAGDFSVNGQQFTANWKVSEDAPQDDKKRLTSKGYADNLAQRLKGKAASIEAAGVQDKETAPPLPFNLVKLQQYMNRQHKMTAAKTLEITQQLREKYKAITYNRSDCSYLSDEQFSEAPQVLDALKSRAEYADLQIDASRKSKAFDSGKVTAHTAIIPTANVPDLSVLSEPERQVYEAIAQHYLVQFMANKRYQEASVVVSVDGETFSSRARQTTDAGFTAFLRGEEAEEPSDDAPESSFDVLKALCTGESGSCDGVTVNEKKTSPPPLFTEATLLAALVRVADFVEDARIKALLKAKDKDKKDEHGGIGTPATRSDMLEKLKTRQYIQLDKGKLIPTDTGLAFFKALPESATLPDMTALWSEQQAEIEQGTKTVDTFIEDLLGQLREQVQSVTVGEIQGEGKSPAGQSERLEAPCPNCGKSIVVRPKLFACTGCDFKIWREFIGKTLTTNQIETLLKKGATGVIKGFTSKAGKKFDTALVLENKQTGKLGFPPRK
ncbi:DNA topoisomerase 3 [Escherichia coli]|nr:DNA topoisomerase 3 [Citrobacter freundii]ELM7841782.1 DNA topoisomerase 3 [Escherichia coli]ELJ5793065.1 DNA topoisomerase 3 [Citrobacter freundii]ELM7885656.1 DNA topoisomerase 3 [Escherichia coli]ELM7953894.1 DNA topoisomerase 3 [Escherichia coli]